MSEPRPPQRLAIVLTPFARPDVVAAACAQLGMSDAVAIPARSGVVVTRPLPPRPVHTDWDISELLGGAPATPSDDDGAARSPGVGPGAGPAEEAGRGPAAGQGADGGAEDGGAGDVAADAGTDGAGAKDAGAEDVASGAGVDDSASDAGSGRSGTNPAFTAPEAEDPAGDDTAAEDPAAPSPRAGEELATAMSTITRRGVVLVTADLGVDTGPESGLAGHVSAREWNAGEPGKDVPPGLILANADEVVEDLVLGRRAPDEIAGAIRAADVTGRGPKRRFFGQGR